MKRPISINRNSFVIKHVIAHKMNNTNVILVITNRKLQVFPVDNEIPILATADHINTQVFSLFNKRSLNPAKNRGTKQKDGWYLSIQQVRGSP